MGVETEFQKRKGLTDSEQDLKSFDAPDLSAQEYAEHTANLTANAFSSTKMFEVVEVKAGIGQVHLLGRVKQDHERAFMDKVVDPVLSVIERTKDCEGHICKQFVRKGGKVRYAWAISFAANDLRSAAYAICEAVNTATPKFEVSAAPLQGPGTPSGGGPNGGRKGASPVR